MASLEADKTDLLRRSGGLSREVPLDCISAFYQNAHDQWKVSIIIYTNFAIGAVLAGETTEVGAPDDSALDESKPRRFWSSKVLSIGIVE